jgi:hypothetical protein
MKTLQRLSLVLCVSFLFSNAGMVQAEKPLPDVRLLIDVSGSMKKSDPQNLRKPALELMVRLLPEGSKAGVWTFGQWINLAVPHGEVNEQWREDAADAVAQISNFGLLTNIPDALERATFDINRLQHQYRTSVILLTDGKVEVSKDAETNRRAALDVLEKYAPELRDWGVTIHTIALSDDADWDFLRALAQVTGGLAERAQSAEELSAVFLQALDVAAPTEQVPLLGGEFLIDESVEEFTVLVFPDAETEQMSLIRPDGLAIAADAAPADTTWYHNERFELITVKEPADGEWRIVAPGSITRVNVISHLSLELDRLPTTMPAGHSPEFGLRLVDADQVLTDPDLLQVLTVNVTVQRSDRRQWDITMSGAEVGSSGEFRIALPMLAEAGRYEVAVHVDGRSFQREVSFLTDVIASAPLIDPRELVPADLPTSGAPGWLLPAAVSLILLFSLGVWWIRRGRDSDWDDAEYDEEDSDEGDEEDDEDAVGR